MKVFLILSLILCICQSTPLVSQTHANDELFEFCKQGNLDEVVARVDKFPALTQEVNERGSRLIHIAARNGHIPIMDYLLGKGDKIDFPSAGGYTPLMLAAYGGHLEATGFLLDKGADKDYINDKMGVSVVGLTITRALQTCDVAIAQMLIERGAKFDVNAPNRFGITHLAMAVQFKCEDGVKLLIGRGADVTIPARQGSTPLHLASINGATEIAQLLVASGADVNARDEKGLAPLRGAIEKGHANIVKLLLSNKADWNVKDTADDKSYLHIAALSGHTDILLALLENNLDVDAKDADGRTPLSYARQYQHHLIGEILAKHGAKDDGRTASAFDAKEEFSARAFYLANRGWIIQLKNHTLVFDAEEFGITRPTQPSLCNGFITVDELRNQNTYAFYTCYHGEIGEPSYIHEIEDSLSIVYVQNADDRWRGCKNSIYTTAGQSQDLDDIRIKTIQVTGGMSTLGYFLEVEGMKIYYAGFNTDDLESYTNSLEELKEFGPVDIAFLPISNSVDELTELSVFMRNLSPNSVCLLDPGRREYLYPEFAEALRALGYKAQFNCAQYPGDRFTYNK